MHTVTGPALRVTLLATLLTGFAVVPPHPPGPSEGVALLPVAAVVPDAAKMNTFDNGRDGTPLSRIVSYDSGDPFDRVSTTRTARLRLDVDRRLGRRGKALKVTTGAGAGTAVIGWDGSSLGSRRRLHASVYLRLSRRPKRALSVLTFANGGDERGTVLVSARRRLVVQDGAGRRRDASGNGKVPLRRWMRIEADFRAGSSGRIEARAYAGSPTPRATARLTRVAMGARADAVRFGVLQPSARTRLWLDSPQVASAAQPGAYHRTRRRVTVREGFEGGDLGRFNGGSHAAVNRARAISGSRSAVLDAGSVASWLEMTQAVHGTDKRYAHVSLRFRYDGPNRITHNQPVLVLRNTSDVLFDGGGHLHLWLDARTGTFRGDLEAEDRFGTGVRFRRGRVYQIAVRVAYRASGSSRAKVWIDGDKVGSVRSRTPGGDWFRSLQLGSQQRNAAYRATYDDVRVTTSRRPLR